MRVPIKGTNLIATICLICPASVAMSPSRDVLAVVEEIHDQLWHAAEVKPGDSA